MKRAPGRLRTTLLLSKVPSKVQHNRVLQGVNSALSDKEGGYVPLGN